MFSQMNGYKLFERRMTLFRHFSLLKNGNAIIMIQLKF